MKNSLMKKRVASVAAAAVMSLTTAAGTLGGIMLLFRVLIYSQHLRLIAALRSFRLADSARVFM